MIMFNLKIKTVELPKKAELFRQTYDKNAIPEGVVVGNLKIKL